MSSKRAEDFANEAVYHVANKAIAKEKILADEKFLKRFLFLLNFYKFNPTLRFSKFFLLSNLARQKYLGSINKNKQIVDIYAFAILDDHFHLLLSQRVKGGISTFLSKVQNGFAKYYNQQTQRQGGVFIRPFKAVKLQNNTEISHVSRYIHLKPVLNGKVDLSGLPQYPWTSFGYYTGEFTDDLVAKEKLTTLLDGESYTDFVNNMQDYEDTKGEYNKLFIV